MSRHAAETDVLIVGAGPVGSYLSSRLSSLGISNILIDKKVAPGKRSCSGLVSTRIEEYVDLKDSYIKNRLYGSNFHSVGSDFSLRRDKVQAIALDRSGFDAHMVENAERSGSDVRLGCSLLDFRRPDGIVESSTSIGLIRSKLIVGCDGAGSIVRRISGLDMYKESYTVNGILGHSDEDGSSDMVDLFYEKDVSPDFFAWRIPKGDSVEYGLASSSDHIGRFSRFTERHGVSIDQHFIHPIRFGIIECSVADNVLLVGDSALQVKPFSGGGIIYGLKCARIASDTISDALSSDDLKRDHLMSYDSSWRSSLEDRIRIGLGIRRTMDSFTDDELDSFFSLMSGNSQGLELFGDMDFL